MKNLKGYRYNPRCRTHRRFNRSIREKNPNRVKFYSRTMTYAEEYRYIYSRDGEEWYECELETAEIKGVFFDMAKDFASLQTYRDYINNELRIMRKEYTEFRDKATTKKDRAMWQKNLDDLVNEEENLLFNLVRTEFQTLSDFERQNQLIEELKEMGYDGYITDREIAVF